MPEALGIYREERFSPGKVADDRAIIDLAAAELGRGGVAVRKAPGESLPSLDRPPALVFAMCQSPAALEWMDEAAKRAIVVNHPSAIRACYRANLLARLDEAGVPQPPWAVAGKEPPTELGGGVWLKRGDVHAMEAGDVRRVFSADEWAAATAEFHDRQIRGAIVQRHAEGAVYKFYGVAGGFFRAYGLPAARGERGAGARPTCGGGPRPRSLRRRRRVLRRRNTRADRRQRLAELLPLPRGGGRRDRPPPARAPRHP